MKKINDKSKIEQIFMLIILEIVLFFMLCVSGCGGDSSCEGIGCVTKEIGDGTVDVVSVPGLGGICSSGKGCDSVLWAQSCKWIDGEWTVEETEESDYYEKADVSGCDVVYYGSCLGCGTAKKSCYVAQVDVTINENSIKGLTYGMSEGDEKVIGSVNGASGCVESEGIGYYLINSIEEYLGVE